MKECFITLAVVVGCVFAFGVLVTSCIDVANSEETTTLEDALERPVVVKKYVDEDNDVVCYYVGRVPDYLNCVQILPGLKRGNAK